MLNPRCVIQILCAHIPREGKGSHLWSRLVQKIAEEQNLPQVKLGRGEELIEPPPPPPPTHQKKQKKKKKKNKTKTPRKRHISCGTLGIVEYHCTMRAQRGHLYRSYAYGLELPHVRQ